MVTAKLRIQSLKARREAIGLTQKDLASRLLVTLSSVNKWENEANNPPHEFILRGWEAVIEEAEKERPSQRRST